jgi:hypothetical protein
MSWSSHVSNLKRCLFKQMNRNETSVPSVRLLNKIFHAEAIYTSKPEEHIR